jgi:hypothetical protein
MQSGKRNTKCWLFEYEPSVSNAPEPLMGWNSGGSLQQIKLSFPTREDAVAYADKIGVDYEVIEPKNRVIAPKSYSANFAFTRRSSF